MIFQLKKTKSPFQKKKKKKSDVILKLNFKLILFF